MALTRYSERSRHELAGTELTRVRHVRVTGYPRSSSLRSVLQIPTDHYPTSGDLTESAAGARLYVYEPRYCTFTDGRVIHVRLSELLRSRGLSQRQLARRTGTHPDVISKFARQATGGISYALLNRICSALGCSPGHLLVYEPDSSDQVTLPIWGPTLDPESVTLRGNAKLVGQDGREKEPSQ